MIDVRTGMIRTRLTGHRLGINALAFSPDGRTLATGGVERCIKIWDLTTAREVATLKDQVGWVNSIAFSPDGRRMAFSGDDESIRLRKLRRVRTWLASPPFEAGGHQQGSEGRSDDPVAGWVGYRRYSTRRTPIADPYGFCHRVRFAIGCDLGDRARCASWSSVTCMETWTLRGVPVIAWPLT